MLKLKTAAAVAALAFGAAANAATPLPMFQGENGYVATPIFTIGQTTPNGYTPVGIPDGIGAYALDSSTVRLFVNAELGNTAGYAYTLGSGASLAGARVQYFDINKFTRQVTAGGLAYDRIYDRAGALVTNASQVGGGLNRFCSGSIYAPSSFGAGKGLADRIYFAGEETTNGTMYALDAATNTLHAVPMMGRAAFENVSQINTGTTSKVAFLMSDDTSALAGQSGSPMYLYVGTKDAKGDGSFLDRNGLADGKLYVWKPSDATKTDPSNFNANGSTQGGSWVQVVNFDASKAGTAGYDALGYADQATIRADAFAKGAFRFSRPEDVATNPADDTLVALASTGSSAFGGADTWGTVYTIKTSFDAAGNPAAGVVTVVYDGNDDASRALRSPDNLDWASATKLLVNEDRAVTWTGQPNTNDGSILELSLDGTVVRAGAIVRNLYPVGSTDSLPGLGDWETSGVLDVSALFGRAQGALFISDVQAHGINLASFAGGSLAEGGQLFFLENTAVPEPATWAMMIGGFGLTGFAMRRRRTGVVAA